MNEAEAVELLRHIFGDLPKECRETPALPCGCCGACGCVCPMDQPDAEPAG